MAAIGTAWVDGSWVEASWVAEAWSDSTSPFGAAATVFLDEIETLLLGSSTPLYPVTSGDYIVEFETADSGRYMQPSTVSGESHLMTLTTSTWPTGLTVNPSGDHVVSLGGVAGANTNWPIFKSHIPDSTVIDDRAIALIETAGVPEHGRIEMEAHGLQVLVRGVAMSSASTAVQEAEDKAQDVLDQVHEYTGDLQTLGQHYVGITNESGPFLTGFDGSWRCVFSANYLALRSE